jgi:hypothetical protein
MYGRPSSALAARLVSRSPATCPPYPPARHRRLEPSGFIFLVQPQHPGYTYDYLDRMFVPISADAGAASQPRGTGFCMAQMSWPDEGYTVDAQGGKTHLEKSVMEVLEERGVE